MSFLPYGRQWIDDEDIAAAADALRSDWLTGGPAIEAFERALADVCGAKYAVACSNGTTALHLTQLALGSKPGDVVVTTPNTFLATANCVRYCGADLRFADIHPDTANIDPTEIEAIFKAEKRPVKGVIPVHFGGHPAEMERIHSLSHDRGCWVVEDACHALGSSFRNSAGETVRMGSCRYSNMTVFSFHPVKHVATGEGGAVTTNDPQLYERLKIFRNHGMVRSSDPKTPWKYEMSEIGFNYRLTDFQAALGHSQLKKLDSFVRRRRQIAAAYRSFLDKIGGEFIAPLVERQGYSSAYHLFPVRIKFERLGIPRGEFMARLAKAGIGTQVHYIPVTTQPYYRELYSLKSGAMPRAESYYEEALSLPMYPRMTDADLTRVFEALTELLGKVSA